MGMGIGVGRKLVGGGGNLSGKEDRKKNKEIIRKKNKTTTETRLNHLRNKCLELHCCTFAHVLTHIDGQIYRKRTIRLIMIIHYFACKCCMLLVQALLPSQYIFIFFGFTFYHLRYESPFRVVLALVQKANAQWHRAVL